MPIFVKKKTVVLSDKHGNDVHHTLEYTSTDLSLLYDSSPGSFIEVTESHAANVLRPQGNYQEVAERPAPVVVEEPVVPKNTSRRGKRVKATASES